MRLLVVEDDPDLNRQLTTALTDAGYVVDRAFDGEEGHFLGDSEPYDAVVLDIGLPKMDGISVLEAWRRGGRAMPVLILTARDRWSDKVQGFDAGADDYVAKPFHLEGAGAGARAVRRSPATPVRLNCGRLAGYAHRRSRPRHPIKRPRTNIACWPTDAPPAGGVAHRNWSAPSQDFDRDSNTIEVFVAAFARSSTSNHRPCAGSAIS